MAKPRKRVQMRWYSQGTNSPLLNHPPWARLERNGNNYMMARSPLLCQGGDFAFPAGCPRRPCPADDLWVTLKRWRKEGNNALSQLIHTFGVVSQDKVFPKLFLKRCPELTIPSAPASVPSRLCFDRAATPSVSGG